MPPVKPKIVLVNGKQVEVVYIHGLAEALGRKSDTIRKWEIGGIIPPTILKDKHGRRLYSKEHVEAIVKIAEEEGIMQGHPFCKTNFVTRLREKMLEINKKYVKKEG